jgi:hypothetical protein
MSNNDSAADETHRVSNVEVEDDRRGRGGLTQNIVVRLKKKITDSVFSAAWGLFSPHLLVCLLSPSPQSGRGLQAEE